MHCKRCGATYTTDEQEHRDDCFDDSMDGFCFTCAEEVWKEREQDALMRNPCQDEGD